MLEQEELRRMMMGAFEEVRDENTFAPEGCEILRELDRGGMAIVYLAQQSEPLREVALKVVLPRFADDEKVRERFKREGRAMAALEHPGVLPVYEVGEWDGLPFIMMKLARGGTLQAILKEGLPDFEEAVEWSISAGEAVDFAHQRGVLHRDLKPGNFLFDEDGTIYVGDFGVAKLEFAQDGGLTHTNMLIGTPNYLAPEVASGEMSGGSVATDLYGMGAVLYECLTGQRPHEGAAATNLAAQLRMIVEDDVISVRKIRPEISADLAMICEKALAKDPENRYETVGEFVDDLRNYQEGREILAGSPGFGKKVGRLIKRHPLRVALGSTLILSALAAGMFSMPPAKRQEVWRDGSPRPLQVVMGVQQEGVSDERPSELQRNEVTMVDGNQSWLNDYVWSDQASPSPENDYILKRANSNFLRTSPVNTRYAGTADFPGNSIRVPQGTRLLIKQIRSEVASINSGAGNLILDGGYLHFGPGGARDFLWKKSNSATPVLRVNEFRVTSFAGSQIALNHNIRRALIYGTLTGPGDLLIIAEKGRDVAGATVAFAFVDEGGFTGTITVDDEIILDFNSDVTFTGSINILSDSRLRVDQVLVFPAGKLIDSVNGVVAPGTYQGKTLASLGDSYVDGGGTIIVEP